MLRFPLLTAFLLVAEAAPWGEPATASPASPAAAGPESAAPGPYWWRAVLARPPAPAVKDTAWAANPIDLFILKKLEERGLSPAPPAGRAVLIRRATFDLTGLPPTPEEVDGFLADDSPDAYPRLIDRLLASPHYGERWARHWLDLVRFAESDGYERDGPKPEAWRYRDYVIRSFNEDKPYDRFIREQLAGDELEEAAPDALIATGFYRLGSWDDEPDDKATARFDELDDVIRTTTGAFLGLTVSCARCHDHKFDPIPQVDYYRLLSFFSGVNHADDVPLVAPAEVERYQTAQAAADQKVKELGGRIESLLESTRVRLCQEKKDQKPGKEEIEKALSEEARKERARLKEEIESVNRSRPARYPVAMGIREEARPPATHLLLRGNARQPGEEVQPGFLSILTARAEKVPITRPAGGKSSGRRRALAEWIADPANLLTARVAANRLWQFHFGRGIVRSPSDFGATGDRPTHPELLDWLAAELVSNGWRLKPLQKTIMLSSAYRMSSRAAPQAAQADPENDLFSRRDLRRLEAEAIRDSILAVSGSLNPKMGGPSVFPRIPAAVLHGQSRPGDGWGKSDAAEACRRSIYVFVKRSLPLPILEVFDSADTGQTCARRNTTTIAPQALTMLNSDFLQEEAAALAGRLIREAGSDPARQVERAYRLALARPPSSAEAGVALDLMERAMRCAREGAGTEPRKEEEARRRALASFALVVFNLNEFIYLD